MSVREWVGDHLRVGQVYEAAPVAEIYRDYSQWCAATNRRPVAVGPFRAYLLSRGLDGVRLGTGRVHCLGGTILEEQSDLAYGVGQIPDREREGQRDVSVEVSRVEIIFEGDYCVVRVPRRIVSELDGGVQIHVHGAEPSEGA